MGTDVTEQPKPVTSTYTYPLQRYLKTRPTREININLDNSEMNKEGLKTFEKIRNLIRTAEGEISNITSNMYPKKETNTVHLSAPQYLDEDFDQKRYIHDLVNAKFNGMNIIEKDTEISNIKKKYFISQNVNKSDGTERETRTLPKSARDVSNNNVLVKTFSETIDKSKHHVPRTPSTANRRLQTVVANSIEIPPENSAVKCEVIIEEPPKPPIRNSQLVEVTSADRDEVKIQEVPTVQQNKLCVQVMPSLNIRMQLMEQKIPSLDIYPEDESNALPVRTKNVALVETKHLDKKVQITEIKESSSNQNTQKPTKTQPAKNEHQHKGSGEMFMFLTGQEDTEFRPRLTFSSKKTQRTAMIDDKYYRTAAGMADFGIQADTSSHMFLNTSNNASSQRSNKNISIAKKYAYPEIQKIFNSKKPTKKGTQSIASTSKSGGTVPSASSVLQKNQTRDKHRDANTKASLQYIPYSKLTIGGFKANEIEKELASVNRTVAESSMANNIVDNNETKILDDTNTTPLSNNDDSERSDNSSEGSVSKDDSQIKSIKDADRTSSGSEQKSDYVDDFDDDSSKSQNIPDSNLEEEQPSPKEDKKIKKPAKNQALHHKTKETKRPTRLDLKDKIEVFDFIHNVETKDHSTQSIDRSLKFKGTQTSPREMEENKDEQILKQKIDISSLTLEDMLQFQKGLSLFNSKFLSNQLFEINSTNNNNPGSSTAIDEKQDTEVNKAEIMNPTLDVLDVSLVQKDTQTSPLKTSHMMTSPAKVVSRLLSPIFKESRRDAQTSPHEIQATEKPVEPSPIEHPESSNTDVPINNLSSPKIILSKLNAAARPFKFEVSSARKTNVTKERGKKDVGSPASIRQFMQESSEAYTDVSESSETHSLGEINLRIFRKKLVTIKSVSNSGSNSNSTSLATSSSSDVPMDSTLCKKSDGEISVGQILDKV